jgi:hypothetical protein
MTRWWATTRAEARQMCNIMCHTGGELTAVELSCCWITASVRFGLSAISNFYLVQRLRCFTAFGILRHCGATRTRNTGRLSTYVVQHVRFIIVIIFSGSAAQRGLWLPRHTRFLDPTKRRATVGRTLLDEWSARRRDLYLTTHKTDKHPCPRWDFLNFYYLFCQNSNPRSQQALDSVATGTDNIFDLCQQIITLWSLCANFASSFMNL